MHARRMLAWLHGARVCAAGLAPGARPQRYPSVIARPYLIVLLPLTPQSDARSKAKLTEAGRLNLWTLKEELETVELRYGSVRAL